MPSFTSERLLDFSRRPGVKVFVAENERSIVGFLTLTEGNIEAPVKN